MVESVKHHQQKINKSWEPKGTPPSATPPENKALLRNYENPLVSLNKAFLGHQPTQMTSGKTSTLDLIQKHLPHVESESLNCLDTWAVPRLVNSQSGNFLANKKKDPPEI